MRISIRLVILIFLVSLMTAGCASMSADTYSRNAAREVQRVEEGEVVYVREVMIEGSRSGLGAIAGGVMGRAVGKNIGSGSGQDLAKAAGTVGGAVAGAAIEEGASRQPGLEITVKLDNGQVISIVQSADVALEEGDLVRVLTRPNGEARVVQ